jgi:hypothetical protein
MIGYIGVAGRDSFGHRFGGDSWKPVDRQEVDGGPTLLLVLDLSDERLDPLGLRNIKELPLASYVNNSIWWGEQLYQVLPDKREVVLESRTVASPESLAEDARLPRQLPERPIMLRMMRKEENPVAAGRLAASDTFVGGEGFIRVLGASIWLQDSLDITCQCSDRFAYAASIGYEVGRRGTLLDQPFFIGEGALYFFVCKRCLRVAVRSQTT